LGTWVLTSASLLFGGSLEAKVLLGPHQGQKLLLQLPPLLGQLGLPVALQPLFLVRPEVAPVQVGALGARGVQAEGQGLLQGLQGDPLLEKPLTTRSTKVGSRRMMRNCLSQSRGLTGLSGAAQP
jgi:hypothetical protein